MPWVKEKHPTVEWKQSTVIGKACKWRRTAHNGNRAHAFRHRPSRREGIRRSAGNPEHAKLLDPQPICELLKQRRPIEQLPLRVKRRISNSRAIRRNDAEVKLARRCVCQLGHGA